MENGDFLGPPLEEELKNGNFTTGDIGDIGDIKLSYLEWGLLESKGIWKKEGSCMRSYH